MKGPVICGIEDGSDDGVAGVARELAERYELPLFFVHVLRDADPADRLVELAHDREASFLVLGNHGRDSTNVSRRASCPVVVVPSAAVAASDADVRGGIVRFASRVSSATVRDDT